MDPVVVVLGVVLVLLLCKGIWQDVQRSQAAADSARAAVDTAEVRATEAAYVVEMQRRVLMQEAHHKQRIANEEALRQTGFDAYRGKEGGPAHVLPVLQWKPFAEAPPRRWSDVDALRFCLGLQLVLTLSEEDLCATPPRLCVLRLPWERVRVLPHVPVHLQSPPVPAYAQVQFDKDPGAYLYVDKDRVVQEALTPKQVFYGPRAYDYHY